MYNYKNSFNKKLYIGPNILSKMREAPIVEFLYWWNSDLIHYNDGSFRDVHDHSIVFYSNVAYDHAGKAFNGCLNTLDYVTKFICKDDFRKATIIMSYFLRSSKVLIEEEILKAHQQGALYINTNEIGKLDSLDSIFDYDKEYNKQIFGYLHNTRKIDRNILSELLARKLMAFNVENKNIMFLTYDNSKLISIEYKGMHSFKKFCQVRSLESNIPFVYCKENQAAEDVKTLLIFESTVDLLSYLTLHSAEKDCIYISTRGTQKFRCTQFAIDRYLNISKIVCCADNDNAGNQMLMDLRTHYSFARHRVIQQFPPIGKDWNDFLIYNTKNIL